ncbi:MAG: hypothetical protein IJ110_00855 [Lachnospiraceae bacterium]|nr:hypothetical protein [Lachnospiraceae bacterium]
MKLLRKPLIFPLLLLIFAFTAAGCSQKAPADVRIELDTPDGSDVSTSDAVFPRFVSNNEEYQKELDKLNKEVDKIRKDYNRRTEKGKDFIVRTYLGSAENVPQCTICWYEEHSLFGDDYNLMTLACKKSSCEIMTSKEALKSHEIDGITLSTNVAKLYEGLGLPGILKETEMQGFETDENAEVTAIFMKLITQIPDPSNPDEEIEEQHFFYYDLTENTLSPLSEHGYDFP